MINYPDYQVTLKHYQEYFELAEKFAQLYLEYEGAKDGNGFHTYCEAESLDVNSFTIKWECMGPYSSNWDGTVTAPAELLFADETTQREWIENYLAELKAKEKAAKEEETRQDKARRLAKAKATIAELEGENADA